MIKVLFICHGNICRSPMAEFIFKDMVRRRGLEDAFVIASAATSREEIGNPVHPGTKRKLREHNIACDGKRAIQVTKQDYDTYDYLIAMDQANVRNMNRMFPDAEHKIHLLLEYAGLSRDIADPWYTGNFDETYEDVVLGCQALLETLTS